MPTVWHRRQGFSQDFLVHMFVGALEKLKLRQNTWRQKNNQFRIVQILRERIRNGGRSQEEATRADSFSSRSRDDENNKIIIITIIIIISFRYKVVGITCYKHKFGVGGNRKHSSSSTVARFSMIPTWEIGFGFDLFFDFGFGFFFFWFWFLDFGFFLFAFGLVLDLVLKVIDFLKKCTITRYVTVTNMLS